MQQYIPLIQGIHTHITVKLPDFHVLRKAYTRLVSEHSTVYHTVPQEINEKAQFKYILVYSVEECLK